MSYNIAIDGPAGAGKSTIAKRVAKKLGYIYVDTGAMYRAMAYYLLRNGMTPDHIENIETICEGAEISIQYVEGEQVVFCNGENVNAFIRTEEVSRMASVSSAHTAIRRKMVEIQKELAKKENVVMDGRDICTVVLPNADLKLFLTASVEVRAKRRYEELLAKGEQAELSVIARDIEERDERDMHREISPLVQAEDATLIDSSNLTIDEVVDKILSMVSE